MVIKIEFTPLSLSRLQHFLKAFLKGNILLSGDRVRDQRGKFDFDHYFAFLTNFL